MSVFERIDRLESGPFAAAWRRLVGVLATYPDTPESALKTAVLTNMLGVIALGDAEDYQHTANLVRRFGHQQVAQIQNELDDLVRLGPHLPLTTAACLELARRTHIERAVATAGQPDEEASALAGKCYATAFWLLMADVDPLRPAPVPKDADELAQVIERRGVDEWRKVLAIIAANPWGPEVSRLTELAVEADLPAPASAMEWCAKVYRKRFEEAERLEVAKEIRRLVAISGCSQRQFAQYIGTSPSRLSTYVNGLVTPSAAMMLRISRSASALAQGATWSGGL
ncbi:helix-turn-helix transcriptional regulator [Nocardioides sp. HM23]|uniref:helix-turn-helix domain-containing protein n=1 Tax=Nocardioides bizhenqiangii TaxID=3095076 RepID=UPI002ACAED51|nr:helix-turn-helix transcriptional regulator [Nocardioides sp. HM23]MDZ5619768.1 helix-turn-helix transcriptional regulator [Nocardioides sp. HM23]